MNRKSFIKALKSYNEIDVFNPYTDVCSVFDRYNADKIRVSNLTKILDQAIEKGVDSIWVGRDLGHRGGRRTGIALTDEAHLADAGDKWDVELIKATKGALLSERTATNIWNLVNAIDQSIFMWNVFPFHPHDNEAPFTNRSHTAKERDEGLEILYALEELITPKKIVAIGNDAYKVSKKIFPEKAVYKIRHPSYGGEKDFYRQLSDLYNLNRDATKDIKSGQQFLNL